MQQLCLAIWDHDTKIEIRLLRPSRRNRGDYFKNVEADLLRWFSVKTGMLPLMKGRFETSWEGLVEYGPSQERLLWQSLGIFIPVAAILRQAE